MTDLLELIPRLKKVASTNGGEYHGPCPLCGGKDRLRAWPEPRDGRAPNWVCRQCNKGGDVINFVRYRDGVGYVEALHILGMPAPEQRSESEVVPPEPTMPPPDAWQERMTRFIDWSVDHLWSEQHTYQDGTPLTYLRRRGFTDETIRNARIGYNPRKFYRACADFGMDDSGNFVLPVGIIIPTFVDGVLWQVMTRTPEGHKRDVRGSVKAMYGADTIRPDRPVIIVEGAMDALAIQQEAGDLIAAVATGTTGARRPTWLFRLARATSILIGLDADAAGRQAVGYWQDCFPAARVWSPLWGDPAQMLQDGANLRDWIASGLESDTTPPVSTVTPRTLLMDRATDCLLILALLAGGMQSEHFIELDTLTDGDLTAFVDRVELRCAALQSSNDARTAAQEDAAVTRLSFQQATRTVMERNRVTKRAVMDEMRKQEGD